jgi:hypothetical protein
MGTIVRRSLKDGAPHGGNAVGGNHIKCSATGPFGTLGALEEGFATIGGAMPDRVVFSGETTQ